MRPWRLDKIGFKDKNIWFFWKNIIDLENMDHDETIDGFKDYELMGQYIKNL